MNTWIQAFHNARMYGDITQQPLMCMLLKESINNGAKRRSL